MLNVFNAKVGFYKKKKLIEGEYIKGEKKKFVKK